MKFCWIIVLAFRTKFFELRWTFGWIYCVRRLNTFTEFKLKLFRVPKACFEHLQHQLFNQSHDCTIVNENTSLKSRNFSVLVHLWLLMELWSAINIFIFQDFLNDCVLTKISRLSTKFVLPPKFSKWQQACVLDNF